nr:unnamed protein product [Digitaria exilis]
MAAAVAVGEVEPDQVAIRAAKILVSLRFRELRERPEWATASREAYEPAPATVEVPERWGRRRPRSCRSRPGSFRPWLKALREMELAGSGGEAVDAATFCAAAAGSGLPSTSSAERAPRAQTRPGDKAAAAKEPMKAPSPDTPLDYGAGGSGASCSADDAARPAQKRRSPGARGSGGGASSADNDDEGCSSPAKRPRVATEEEKPIPMRERRGEFRCLPPAGHMLTLPATDGPGAEYAE